MDVRLRKMRKDVLKDKVEFHQYGIQVYAYYGHRGSPTIKTFASHREAIEYVIKWSAFYLNRGYEVF
jgi:hypothetical protein